MNKIIHAAMTVAGIDARFLVNDIAVANLRHRRSTFSALPIHEFLVEGENTLQIVRTDAPKEAESEPGDELFASLTLAGFAVGEQPGVDPGDRLSTLRLSIATPAAPTAPTAPGAPVAPVGASVQGKFALPSWPHPWSWAALPAFDWSGAKAVALVAQYLRAFADKFQQGDSAWLLAELQQKMGDYCRAYGIDYTGEAAEFSARMGRRMADPSFKTIPFADADLALQACAQGRLVECTVKTGEPAMRWHDARVGDRGTMVLRLGYADRRLRVFR